MKKQKDILIIQTRYDAPAGRRKQARVTAWCTVQGTRKSISQKTDTLHRPRTPEPHRKAIEALCAREGLKGRLLFGLGFDGYVAALIPAAICEAKNIPEI